MNTIEYVKVNGNLEQISIFENHELIMKIKQMRGRKIIETIIDDIVNRINRE